MRRKPRDLPPKTASLEPMNGVDLRVTGVDQRAKDLLDNAGEQFVFVDPLCSHVLAKAVEHYPDQLVRLEPLPNTSEQRVYTIAVKAARLSVESGPGSLEWKTVLQGTLPELLQQLEASDAGP